MARKEPKSGRFTFLTMTQPGYDKTKDSAPSRPLMPRSMAHRGQSVTSPNLMYSYGRCPAPSRSKDGILGIGSIILFGNRAGMLDLQVAQENL
jgi:hypothetical protein